MEDLRCQYLKLVEVEQKIFAERTVDGKVIVLSDDEEHGDDDGNDDKDDFDMKNGGGSSPIAATTTQGQTSWAVGFCGRIRSPSIKVMMGLV